MLTASVNNAVAIVVVVGLLHLVDDASGLPTLGNASEPVSLMTLADLWEDRGLAGRHLFPTRSSAVYPEFAAVLVDGGHSRMHLTRGDVEQLVRDLTQSPADGTVVHSVCSYQHLNATFFAVNTAAGSGWAEVLIDANMSLVEQRMAELTARRVKVNFICVGAHDDVYSAVWHHSNEFVWHFIVESGPIQEIVDRDALQMRRGYYADCFQTYREGNVSRAIVIWRKGFGKRYKIQYGTNVTQMLVDMGPQPAGSVVDLSPVQFAALPRQGRRRLSQWILWHGDEFSWANASIPKHSTSPHEWAILDQMVEHRMRSYDIPSMSVHVLRNGDDVYSATYGYADVLRHVEATPQHRYRIASVSKVLTAMGIGELVVQRKLDLMHRIFDEDGILREFCQPCHPFLRNIRVIHLLEHSSGAWPHTKKFEFERMELNQTAFLSKVVQEEFPRFFPGQRHLYSNIGFILLGKVIEQLSGKDYATFINETVLTPLGIVATIGKEGNTSEEVTYYSQDNANAYTSWNPLRLNAAAGWSMTAKDVARLFNNLEKNKYRKYRWMITPSTVRWSYGRGIQLGADGSLYHIGSLAGTEAIGYSWRNVQVAILTNMRGREQNEQTSWMEKVCQSIADGRLRR